MGFGSRAILAGGLGFTLAFVVACGNSTGLLSSAQSSSLGRATTAPARSMDEVIDPETGEVTEVARPYKIEAKTWADLIGPLTDAILNCRSIGEYDEWITANQDALLKMKETKPDLYKLFEKNIDAKRAELNAKYEQERSNV